MGAGDDPVPGQLPDVEFVHGEDPVNLRHQLLLETVHLDVGRYGLEEDQGRLNQQRPDRLEDQEDQEPTREVQEWAGANRQCRQQHPPTPDPPWDRQRFA